MSKCSYFHEQKVSGNTEYALYFAMASVINGLLHPNSNAIQTLPSSISEYSKFNLITNSVSSC